jgi:hypothetical protein
MFKYQLVALLFVRAAMMVLRMLTVASTHTYLMLPSSRNTVRPPPFQAHWFGSVDSIQIVAVVEYGSYNTYVFKAKASTQEEQNIDVMMKIAPYHDVYPEVSNVL